MRPPADASHPARLPEWIAGQRIKLADLHEMKRGLRAGGLHTVCEEARCPNRAHCFGRGTATFLLMGEACTRDCGFCSIAHGKPLPPDPAEPGEVAAKVASLGIKYAVLTSVTRDDLPDGGAAHFAAAIRAVGGAGALVEVLVPDFGGDLAAVAAVVAAVPCVFNHNLETVPELYPRVRPGADYGRSLKVLVEAKRLGGGQGAGATGGATGTGPGPAMGTKSGLMLGFGETGDQLARVFDDLAAVGVDILTLGQYLRPTRWQLPVHEYVHPDRFAELADVARARGVPTVFSGPLVRSSYHAGELAEVLALGR